VPTRSPRRSQTLPSIINFNDLQTEMSCGDRFELLCPLADLGEGRGAWVGNAPPPLPLSKTVKYGQIRFTYKILFYSKRPRICH